MKMEEWEITVYKWTLVAYQNKEDLFESKVIPRVRETKKLASNQDSITTAYISSVLEDTNVCPETLDLVFGKTIGTLVRD